MTKTLRVELADLEGIPHGSAPAATRAEITAAYTGIVALTDGTLIPNAIKAKTVASSGVVNFSVYPSDSPDVREEYRGFGVTVTAKVQSLNGTTVTARRTVVVPDSSPSTVHLGNLPPADPLPPQWATVGDLVGDIEAAAGTAEWAGITDKPESFPPTEHDHAMDDVTGLTAQLSGTVNFGGFPLTFGPGGQLTVGGVLQTTYSELQNRPLSTEVACYRRVVAGNEPRPARASMVFWIGGTTEPTNMAVGDVWLAAD